MVLGFTSALFTFAFILFHFMGNSVNSGKWSRSALVWLFHRWNDSGIAMGSGDYSHGFLVPIASLYVVWMQRDALLRAPKKSSVVGLGFVVLALIAHYLGVKVQHTRLSILSLIGLFWSVPFYLYGWQVAKMLIFPCSFLIFAVPLNFLDGLSFPLRMINTTISVNVLQFLGLDVKQVGTGIYGPPYNASATLRLDVADPCSGIRSLTAMMALTAIYGYLVLNGLWRKWILFLAAIPLAMAGNIFRIVSIGIMAEAINTNIATGISHDYAGFIVFGCAIALMVSLSLLLKHDFSRKSSP
jgi:exosortase